MFLTIVSFVINSFLYTISYLYYVFSLLHTVLPFGLDVGLCAVAAYYFTKIKKANRDDVVNIFGPEPGSKESELHPEKVVRCIAHRGAGFDAPENTMEAFKYCIEQDCYFVELDVRTCKDGQLVLLHDQGLQRLTSTDIIDVHSMDWDNLKDIDVSTNHPNRSKFKEARLCLLNEALDFLLSKNARIIIDVKGEDKQLVEGILKTYQDRPTLYKFAAVTSFNPFIIYQIRKRDPKIVGALSYRPYCFSAVDYDADSSTLSPRFADRAWLTLALRACDAAHAGTWRLWARWAGVSAVLLHKDMVCLREVAYWRARGVRCAGWCVNRPLEKLYWRGVLKAPYLANTLLGEPEEPKKLVGLNDSSRTSRRESALEEARRMSNGQN